MTITTGTLYEHVCTFTIMSQSFLKIRNISDKGLDNIKTQCTSSKFYPPENHVVYEIMWQNMEEPGRPKIGACTYCAG
jgi:hypothetical protein